MSAAVKMLAVFRLAPIFLSIDTVSSATQSVSRHAIGLDNVNYISTVLS